MESPLRESDLKEVRLIETIGWHPGEGFRRLEQHLLRMADAAARLGFDWDGSAVERTLAKVGEKAALRVRVTLGASGDLEVETTPLGPPPSSWRVAVSGEIMPSDDPWRQVKSTRREIYDTVRARFTDGIDEVIFLNESGYLTEGTITNLFVEIGDGLLTPPLSAGVLPGVLRAEMIADGKADEAELTVADLHAANAIFVGNSLRGLIPVELT